MKSKMFYQCHAYVLLVLPFFAAADPILLKNGAGFSELAEHETLRMFEDFLSTFGREYGSEDEYKSRYAIFKDNLKTIDQLNREKKGTAKFGVTRFADLTYDEFVRKFTGGRIPANEWERHERAMEHEPEVEIEFLDDDFERRKDIDMVNGKKTREEDEIQVADGRVYLPRKYDYRKKKAVTPVKDQGKCASCWAFSTIANIEGIYAKSKKKLFNLAEQELVDCDMINNGCFGGWMQNAVVALVGLGGVAKTSDYPYVAGRQTCRFNKSMAVVTVSGTKSIPADEKKIARALVKNGPLSSALVVSSSFRFYKSGVFDPSPSECSRDRSFVNHGVTIVGYGEELISDKKKKLPFWVIKNSWGSSWGEKGYMRIARGNNACAVGSLVSTAYL